MRGDTCRDRRGSVFLDLVQLFLLRLCCKWLERQALLQRQCCSAVRIPRKTRSAAPRMAFAAPASAELNLWDFLTIIFAKRDTPRCNIYTAQVELAGGFVRAWRFVLLGDGSSQTPLSAIALAFFMLSVGFTAPTASATVLIQHDHGGHMRAYEQRFAQLARQRRARRRRWRLPVGLHHDARHPGRAAKCVRRRTPSSAFTPRGTMTARAAASPPCPARAT